MRMEIANLNPELQNSQWSVVALTQKTKEDLYREVHDRARELFRGSPTPGESSSEPKAEGRTSPAKKTLAKGLAETKLIGDDTQLLQMVVDLHGIGRVDIKGEDGVWVAGGRLTDKGKEAVRSLEDSAVAIRLISPPESLVRDLLSAASKPFIITGAFEIGEELSRIAES